MISFIPLFIILALEIIEIRNYKKLFAMITSEASRKIFWFVNLVMLAIICIKPAANSIGLYHEIYNKFDKPAILYYIDENPYGDDLIFKYYKHENLSFRKINNIAELGTNVDGKNIQLYLAKNNKQEAELKANNIIYKKVYSRYPEWTKPINFRGWLQNKRNWTVYEINRGQNLP